MKILKILPLFCLIFLFTCLFSFPQGTPPGIAEINASKAQMTSNFIALSKLVFVLGALAGLLGGLRVFNNWQMGRNHIDNEVISWFSACIFLAIMGIFLSGLFNVPLS